MSNFFDLNIWLFLVVVALIYVPCAYGLRKLGECIYFRIKIRREDE